MGILADVTRASQTAIEQAIHAPDGSWQSRFILSSCFEVPRDTPPENLHAMVRAAHEFGRYE